MEFNDTVHQADEHGDPVRNDDGAIRLRTNWKDLAKDRLGRKFNPNIHGEEKLDEEGFLVVKRRDAGRNLMSTENRSDALVAKHKEPGYAYYLTAEENEAKFSSHEWEQVMDADGPVTLDGGQARNSRTTLKLKRKPQEWYDQDQQDKARLIDENLEASTAPGEDQYGEGLKSPLR